MSEREEENSRPFLLDEATSYEFCADAGTKEGDEFAARLQEVAL